MNDTERKAASILRFRLITDNAWEAFKVFNPNGQRVLNSTEWRGKPPRTCAVTSVKANSTINTEDGKRFAHVEVTYRPKGVITYVGNTKYDGWTAMMLDKNRDGTLLDGKGNPLPPGAPPVFLPFEVYGEADFNKFELGDFIEETVVETVKHTTSEEVEKNWMNSRSFSVNADGGFLVARRQRPTARIMLFNGDFRPMGESHSKIFAVNRFAPHLANLIEETLYEVVAGYFEGRLSLTTFTAGDLTHVWLQNIVFDVTVDNQDDETPEESKPHSLFTHIRPEYLDELALRLMSTYEVDITVVDGQRVGFLLKHSAERPRVVG